MHKWEVLLYTLKDFISTGTDEVCQFNFLQINTIHSNIWEVIFEEYKFQMHISVELHSQILITSGTQQPMY